MSDDSTMMEKIETLIELATRYAEQRNLDTEKYLDGVLSFHEEVDPEPIVDILIRYHREWLR